MLTCIGSYGPSAKYALCHLPRLQKGFLASPPKDGLGTFLVCSIGPSAADSSKPQLTTDLAVINRNLIIKDLQVGQLVVVEVGDQQDYGYEVTFGLSTRWRAFIQVPDLPPGQQLVRVLSVDAKKKIVFLEQNHDL